MILTEARAIEDVPEGETYLIQGSQANGNVIVQSDGFQVFGRLLLESANAGYQSSLTLTNGMLTNTVSGVIDVNAGSGGPRAITGDWLNLGMLNANFNLSLDKPSGNYYNAGTFNITTGQTVTITGPNQVFNQNGGQLAVAGALDLIDGRFNYHGGDITGNPIFMINSALMIGSAATKAARFTMSGDGSTFQGEVWPGQTVWIQGNSRGTYTTVTAPGGFRNAGLLLLESRNAGYSSSLTVNSGVLTNMSGGVITANAGSGGPRVLSAHLLNLGTINANYPLTLTKANGIYDNAGTFNIAAGRTVSIAGQGQVFNQIAGKLSILGTLDLSDLRFNYQGGEITGNPVFLVNCDLTIDRTATLASRFTLTGSSSTFQGDISPGQTIWIQGSSRGSYTTVTAPNGFQNRGLLRLESVNAGYDSGLSVNSGVLTNASGGIIAVNEGSAGPRTLSAHLLNQGMINVNHPLTLSRASGTYSNLGTINIATNQTVTIDGQNQVFNQTAGQLNVAGALNLYTMRLNYQGGEITGNPVYLVNCALVVDPSVTNAARFTLTGSDSTFQGNLWPAQTVWIQGNSQGSHTTVTAPNGFLNRGTLLLESRQAGYASILTVNSGVLTNAAGGIINANVGSTGSRTIAADLLNQGIINANQNLTLSANQFLNQGTLNANDTVTFSLANGVVENTGLINIASGQSVTLNGQNQVFNQTEGKLNILGGLNLWNGRFNFQGGAITGNPPYLVNCALTIGPAATQGAGYTLSGSDSTFQGDIGPGQTVWIQGNSQGSHTTVTAPVGFLNRGILLLESRNAGYSSSLTVSSGVLTNAASGIINANVGSTGPRTIAADLLNQGTINANINLGLSGNQFLNEGTFNANDAVTFSWPNGVFENRGLINIASGQTVTLNGQNQVFNQIDGKLNILGGLSLTGGRFNFQGGEITGNPPYLVNCALTVDPAATQVAGYVLSGSDSTLQGDIRPGQTLWIQGNSQGSHTTVTAPVGFLNRGTLLLESRNAGYSSSLTVGSGVLTNGIGGILTINPGTGGGRTLSANLLNQGTVNVNDSLNLSRANGTFDNAGAFNIASGQTVTINGQSQVFNQIAGRINNSGALNLDGIRFNFLGGEITGRPVYLVNCDLAIGPAATNAAQFTLTHSGSTLQGDTWPGQLIRIQGDGNGGYTTITVPNGFQNRGTLVLESQHAGYASSLTVSTGILANAATGIIDINRGSGGPREMAADLLNQGIFNANYNVTVGKAGGTFLNEGQVNVPSGVNLDVMGSYAQAAGVTRLNGGTLTADQPIHLQGGQLSGAGTISASVLNEAQVAPGTPLGQLQISGNYTQAGSGVLEIEIGGPAGDLRADQLLVSGSAQIAGKLRVNLAGDSLPTNGASFVILRSANLAGAFDDFDLPQLEAGMGWEVFYDAQTIRLRSLYQTNVAGQVIGSVRDRQGKAIADVQVFAFATVPSFAGLRGEYYDNVDFTGLKLERLDPQVIFNWGSASPDPAIGSDTFSVRWTGQLTPLYAEPYTFYTVSDDGIRLWINDQLIINNWTDHAPTENSGTISLTNRQEFNLKMEWYENGGGAVAQLRWSSPSQPKEVIPAIQMAPTSTTNLQPSTTKAILVNTTTDANGQYQLDVLNGPWTVGVIGLPTAGYSAVSNQTVTVENNSPTVDFVAEPFAGQFFTVTALSNPAEAGTVTGAGRYAANAVVTLRAVPNTNAAPYYFVNWSESGLVQSTNSTFTFTLTRNRQLVANFNLPSFQLVASNEPPYAGTVEGAGIYRYGTTNRLTAHPKPGYRFAHWSEGTSNLGTNLTLTLVVEGNRLVVAHYLEANPFHIVSTATAPPDLAVVTGAGHYTNGQTAQIRAPLTVTNLPYVYSFGRFLLNEAFYGEDAAFAKTFSTLDPTNLLFVAEYERRHIQPQLVKVIAGVFNPFFNVLDMVTDPVPALTNYQVLLQFDRPMRTNPAPQITFTNLSSALQIRVPTGGVWTATSLPGDTYTTPFITLTAGMDGPHQVWVAQAQDLTGSELLPTHVLTIVIDTIPPEHPALTLVSSNSSSAVVGWSDFSPPSDLNGFRVYLQTNRFDSTTGLIPLTRLDASVRSFQFGGLELDTDYYLAVAAVDAAGNSRPAISPLAVRLPTSLPPPVSVQVTASSPNTARVTWSSYDPSPLFGFAGYQVYVEQTPFTSVAALTPKLVLGPEAHSADISELDRAKVYYLAVVGFNRHNAFNDHVTPRTWSDPLSGELTGDLAMGAPGESIAVYRNIVVVSNATLTIQAGATLRFAPGTGLIVQQGRLIARGTALDPIVFTSLADQEGSNPATADWNGIVLAKGASGSVLDQVWIKYGRGLTLDGVSPAVSSFSAVFNDPYGIGLTNGATLTTRHAWLTLNEAGVWQTDSAQLRIADSVIKNNRTNAVAAGTALLMATQNWWGTVINQEVSNLLSGPVWANPRLDYEPLLTPAAGTANGQTQVGTRQIALKLACRTAESMRLSEDSVFTGVFFKPFAPEQLFDLSEGAGRKTLYVQFRSVTGQTNTPLALNLEYITEGPVIRSFNLAEGQLINRPVEVSGSATAVLGMAEIQFHVDNRLEQSVAGANYAQRWDIRNLASGIHRVKLLARDTGGHIATLEKNVLINPTPPPAPLISAPAADLLLTTNQLTVQGTAEPLVAINLTRNGQWLGSTVAGADGAFTFANFNLVEGRNQIVAIATDNVGNASSTLRTVFVDTGGPAPLLWDPPVYQPGIGLGLTWHYAATGERATRFQVFWRSTPFTSTNQATQSSELLTRMSHFVQGLADSTYYFGLVGYDDAGNASPLSTLISAQYDAVAPQLSIQYDKFSPVGPGPLRVTLSANEPLAGLPSLTLWTPGSRQPQAVTLTNIALNTYEGVAQITSLMLSGKALWVATAYDPAGNGRSDAPAGPDLILDVTPPLGAISTAPSSPIQTQTPTNAAVTLILSEPAKLGSVPALEFHPPEGLPVAVTLTGESTNWVGALPLEPAMGSGFGTFALTVADALDNVGTNILLGARVEIYNTAVPTPPNRPTGLEATTLPDGYVRLSWLAVSNAELYRLYSEEGVSTGAPQILVADELVSLVTTNRPPQDGVYRYSVTALRRGAESLPSAIAVALSDRTAPGAPVDVAAQLLLRGVQVTWKAPVSGEYPDRFNVYRNEMLIRSVVGVTPVTDSPPRGVAQYVIGAADVAGNETRSQPATLQLLVGAVDNLEALVNLGQAPVLRWTVTDPTAVGVQVYRNGIKQTGPPVAASEYVDPLPMGQAPVEYAVKAANAAGDESAPRTVLVYPLEFALEVNDSGQNSMNLPVSHYFDRFDLSVSNRATAGEMTLGQVELRRTVLINRDGTSEQFTVTQTTNTTIAAGSQWTLPLVLPSAKALLAQALRMRVVHEDPLSGSRAVYQRLFDFGEPETPVPLIEVIAREQPLAGGLAAFDLRLFNHGFADMNVIVTRNRGKDPGDVYVSVKNAQGQEVSRAEFNGAPPGTQLLPSGVGFITVAPGTFMQLTVSNVLVPEALALNTAVTFQGGVDNIYHQIGTAQALESGPLLGTMKTALAQTDYYGTAQTDKAGYANEETIHISGQAINRALKLPVPNVPLKIGFAARGFRWYRQTNTDEAGNYQLDYRPIEGFGGRLTIWAAHPLVFDTLNQAQVDFHRLYANPALGDIRMSKNETIDFSIDLYNPGEIALEQFTTEFHAYRMEGTNAVPITTVTGTPLWAAGLVLRPKETRTVNLQLAAALEAPDNLVAEYRIVSRTGAAATFTANVTLLPAVPVLTVETPAVGYVEVSVNRGNLLSRSVTVANRGLRDLKGIELVPPAQVGWMQVNLPLSPEGRISLPDIGVGQSYTFQVVFAPPAATALDHYRDFLTIKGTNSPAEFKVNLFALVTSSQKGAVQFYVDNILTEPVTRATIRLRNLILQVELPPANTATNGLVTVSDLQEGAWSWQATAPGHSATVGTVTVVPSQTVQVSTRLSKSLVTVNFSVTPVPYTDRYEITIEQTFETHVPAPVLVLNPAMVNFNDVRPGFETNMVVLAKNYGLIELTDVQINGSDYGVAALTPLITFLPRLRPMETVEIPFRAVFNGLPERSTPAASPALQKAGLDRPSAARISLLAAGEDGAVELAGSRGVKQADQSLADEAKDAFKSWVDCTGSGGVGFLSAAEAMTNLHSIVQSLQAQGEFRCVDGSLATAGSALLAGFIFYSAVLSPVNVLVQAFGCAVSEIAKAIVKRVGGGSGRGGGFGGGSGSGGGGFADFQGSGPACFAPGTWVLLADGHSRPIEQVQIRDVVRTGLGAGDVAQVDQVQSWTVSRTRQIQFKALDAAANTGAVVATDEHLFWVDGQGWTEAARLRAGDWLMSARDTRLEVTANTVQNKPMTVHTLRCRQDHAFYANGILVHDLCGLPPPPELVSGPLSEKEVQP